MCTLFYVFLTFSLSSHLCLYLSLSLSFSFTFTFGINLISFLVFNGRLVGFVQLPLSARRLHRQSHVQESKCLVYNCNKGISLSVGIPFVFWFTLSFSLYKVKVLSNSLFSQRSLDRYSNKISRFAVMHIHGKKIRKDILFICRSNIIIIYINFFFLLIAQPLLLTIINQQCFNICTIYMGYIYA